MAGISDIVNVTITRETVMPLGLDFGWVNFVSAAASFTPRIKLYGSNEEVQADSAAGADTKAFANLYFGQEVKPTRLYVTKKTTDSYVQALDAATLVNDEWYGIAIASVTVSDQLAVAAWAEPRTKILMVRAATSDVIDGDDTDDVASQLQDLGYMRTSLFYHHQAASVFVEAAPLGLQLPKKPGSSQWAYKRFAGVTPSPLTVGERTAALNKNANVYSDRANISVFEQGKMVGGEWIDTVIGIDKLTQDIESRVYGALVNNEKIPYTDDGINIIVNQVEAALRAAVDSGILAANPPPVVTAPLAADVSPTNKGNRILPDIDFKATLAGAIIKAQIVGRILL